MGMQHPPLIPPLTPSELYTLRALVAARRGVHAASKELGISRSTLVSAIADAPLRDGSRAMIRVALAALAARSSTLGAGLPGEVRDIPATYVARC